MKGWQRVLVVLLWYVFGFSVVCSSIVYHIWGWVICVRIMTFAYTCIDHVLLYRKKHKTENRKSWTKSWVINFNMILILLFSFTYSQTCVFGWLDMIGYINAYTTYLQHIFELNCKLIIPVENLILIARNSNARIENISGQCSFDLNSTFYLLFFFKFKSNSTYSHDWD